MLVIEVEVEVEVEAEAEAEAEVERSLLRLLSILTTASWITWKSNTQHCLSLDIICTYKFLFVCIKFVYRLFDRFIFSHRVR